MNTNVKGLLAQSVTRMLPDSIRDTVYLRAFGLFKVPVLFYIRPKVEHVDDEKCVVRVPLNRRTKNHVNSMYFGVLACGADISAGFIAIKLAEEMAPGGFSIVFKDFKAQFLKRVEGDALFTCNQGALIHQKMRESLNSGERQNFPVTVTATVPSRFQNDPVAQFELTLSVKYIK